MAIFFHTIGVNPNIEHKSALKRWINACVLDENKLVGEINVIFCTDDHLLEINRTHLNHDYYTDIITFDYTEKNKISGDLFISFERVIENAINFNVDTKNELYRVIIHGVMHLCGYKDKSRKESRFMRIKEQEALLKSVKFML
jgi:rRNA maturation RNase YbeY